MRQVRTERVPRRQEVKVTEFVADDLNTTSGKAGVRAVLGLDMVATFSPTSRHRR
jgi:hypothetical protein